MLSVSLAIVVRSGRDLLMAVVAGSGSSQDESLDYELQVLLVSHSARGIIRTELLNDIGSGTTFTMDGRSGSRARRACP